MPLTSHALAAEEIEQLLAAFVVPNHAHGQHASAQFSKVVHRIRRAARIRFATQMPQNQHGSFARDARNFAGDEFVEHEIADHADRLLRKRAHDIEQARQINARVSGSQTACGPFGVRLRPFFGGWLQRVERERLSRTSSATPSRKVSQQRGTRQCAARREACGRRDFELGTTPAEWLWVPSLPVVSPDKCRTQSPRPQTLSANYFCGCSGFSGLCSFGGGGFFDSFTGCDAFFGESCTAFVCTLFPLLPLLP